MEQTDYLIIPADKFEEILVGWQKAYFGEPTPTPQYHQLQSAMYNLRANLAPNIMKAAAVPNEPLAGAAIDSDPAHVLVVPDENPDAELVEDIIGYNTDTVYGE